MKEKFTILRYITYSIVIFILYILQGVPNLIPEIYGSKPVLLIAFALIVASYEKEIPSTTFGFACGLLCDLGISNTIGYFTIVLTIICYFQSLLLKTVVVKNFINTMLLSFVSVVLIIGLYFVFFYILQGFDHALYYFTSHYLSRIIYTFLCCILLYFINKFIYSELKEKEIL